MGIGRPSTFATIITTIIARNYVKREGKSLVATPTGELTEENEFYIRLYSENYPGLYYEVGFCTDENGMAYLTDMVTGKTVPCPDEVTVRMIG